ncbi:hypothetical protein [Novosphingobium sp.]|uniref:hypothetical protein n=1 Tax=Novosphingobium sp. TaxID=1874826 RepID=UPI0025DE0887|nr:hypothetical protein [Novosphingobium sp.]
MRGALAGAAWLFLASAPAFAEPLTLDAVRRSELGDWQGKLEYRDYQSDRWFGLPVTVHVTDGGDGVTQIRTADFDDGPKSAPKAKIVRITTVSIASTDGRTSHSVSFRKGEVPEVSTSTVLLDPASSDARHWTVIETEAGRDDNRPAEVRVTTRRDGDSLTSLKEVHFTGAPNDRTVGKPGDKVPDKAGDKPGGWHTRNRTLLTRIPGNPQP